MKSWKYVIRTGNLYNPDGKLVGIGYAGKGEHKNDPSSTTIHDKGPLPVGTYTIEPSYTHPHLGPLAMNLEPAKSNEMYGRSLFRIHADSIEHPGTASDGCIVMDHKIRAIVSLAQNRQLEVVAEEGEV